jgi:MarR family transcriptional regulator, temperature-dependent positive regulator of motility
MRFVIGCSDISKASQRELAQHLAVSVGKINYCVRALIAKGLVKMRNFRGSKKKLAYVYVLTPKGIEEKVNVTSLFLKRKLAEYDSIVAEIARLTSELADSGSRDRSESPYSSTAKNAQIGSAEDTADARDAHRRGRSLGAAAPERCRA